MVKGFGSTWMVRVARCAIVVALASPVGVMAQDAVARADAAPAPNSVTPQADGEIVVTAQKREQRLQDVPLSVNVLSADTLTNNRVTGIEQLAQISPSINFTNSGNTRGQGVSVRGIGTLNFSDGVEPSVATVVDGVVIGRSAASFFDFNDIERIEVLRGPQGTLFGKNASAGALNVVTERPSLTRTTLDASASYGRFDDLRLKGSASIAFDPGRMALRLSGYRSKADGIITNRFDGQNLNNTDTWGARGKFLYAVSDVTSIYAIGDYSENNRNCCVSTVRSVLPTTTYYNGQTRAALLAGQRFGPGNREVTLDGESFNRQKTGGGSLEVSTEIGGQDVTSVTAYRKFRVFDNNDTDGVPLPVFSINNARQQQKQFTQELRIASPANATVEYVAGLFYFWQDVATTTQIRGNGLTNLPAGQYLGNQIVRDIETNNVASFGQLTWHLSDPFSLIGGFRLTAEDANANFARSVLPGANAVIQVLGGPVYTAPTLKAGNTDFSYRLGTQYKFTPDIISYVTYTRGYKGPALNLLNNLNAATVTSGQAVLKPEIAKNWEAGLRTTLLDRRLTLNVTGFHTSFTNFQAQTFNSVLNTFTLANAGKLLTRGAEVEATLRPLRGLSLSANIAYTDTEVRGLIIGCAPGQTAAQGCVAGRQDVTGSTLANAPKWAYTLNGNYSTDLGTNLRGIANLTYTYRSRVFFNYNDAGTVQPGYGLLNGTLSVETADSRYRFTIFGKNLANKRFASLISTGFLDTSATGAGYTQLLTTDAFRTFGAEVAVRF